MHPAETPISLADPASLREVYLHRLERLVRLRSQHEQELNGRGILLLDRSIFAAYCDCRYAGVESEARRILREAQFLIDQPPGLQRSLESAQAGGSLLEAQPEA